MSVRMKGNKLSVGHVKSKIEIDAIKRRMVGNKLNVGRLASFETRRKMSEKRSRDVEWVVMDTGCWECISHKCSGGYPYVTRNKKSVHAHKFIYERDVGVVPRGMVVRHKCDNKLCVNPNHLEIGTVRDNVLDAVSRGQHPRGERVGTSKLSEDDVRYILSMRGKVNRNILASEFGIDRMHVNVIWRRAAWKHVVVD